VLVVTLLLLFAVACAVVGGCCVDTVV